MAFVRLAHRTEHTPVLDNYKSINLLQKCAQIRSVVGLQSDFERMRAYLIRIYDLPLLHTT